jgi:signal transduction histidine kinase
LDAVIAEIREFITQDAATDKSVDLSAVLRALVQRARTGTTAQIILHCEAAASERLTGNQAVQLANIAREALSNSLRHAKANRVAMALYPARDAMILEISDDGQGFDSKQPAQSGIGLTSMMARTQEMGGTLEIQSAPGQGTRVVARVPISPLEGAPIVRASQPVDHET